MIISRGLVLALIVFNVFNVTWLNKRRSSLLEKKPCLFFYFITLKLSFRFPEAPASWCRPRACSHCPASLSSQFISTPSYKNTFYQELPIGHPGLGHRWVIFTLLSVLPSGLSRLSLHPAAVYLQELLLPSIPWGLLLVWTQVPQHFPEGFLSLSSQPVSIPFLHPWTRRRHSLLGCPQPACLLGTLSGQQQTKNTSPTKKDIYTKKYIQHHMTPDAQILV